MEVGDWASQAAAIALAPAATTFASEAGREAWAAVRTIARSLLGLEEESAGGQEGTIELSDAARELSQHGRDDPATRNQIVRSLEAIKSDSAGAVFLTQVSGQASVGKIVSMGHVEGDVSI